MNSGIYAQLQSLLNVARQGNQGIVRAWISGADTSDENIRDMMSQALLVAAKRGHAHICGDFLCAGADPTMPSSSGNTAMHHAVIADSVEVYQLLRDYGVNIEIRGAGKSTPLHFAAIVDRPAVCRELIKDGANIAAQDICGTSSLMHAVRAGHIAVAEMLIQAGANVQERDAVGWTLFHHAAFSYDVPLCRLLVRAGVTPSVDTAPLRANRTPLEWAIVQGRYDAVRYFVRECGATLRRAPMERPTDDLHVPEVLVRDARRIRTSETLCLS